MLNLFLKYSANLGANGKVNIAIVGGGATGVELSAELHNAVKQLHSYGYKGLTNEALNVTLVEAVSAFCLRCRRAFPGQRIMS